MKSLRLEEPSAYLRYLDFPGAGTPMVMLHGMGCASTIDYPRVIANPALAGRRYVLPDLLGHGMSDAPEDFSYTIAAHAETVAALLDHLSIKDAIVFGHSAGGSVAIMLAAQRPDLVSRLIASEANLDPGGGTFSKGIAAQSEQDFITKGHREAVERVMKMGGTSRVATFRGTDSIGFYRTAVSLVAGSTPTWRELLYGFKIPRSWIVGEKSDPEDDIKAHTPHGISVYVVPDADHDMAFGNPDGVAEAIARAIEDS